MSETLEKQMTPQDRVRELDKAATPGPLHIGGIFNPETAEAFAYVYPEIPAGQQSTNPIAINVPVADARLFAEFRTLAPQLADLLDAAEAKLNRAAWLVRQIVNSLPTRRDWLDPDIEKEAKALATLKP